MYIQSLPRSLVRSFVWSSSSSCPTTKVLYLQVFQTDHHIVVLLVAVVLLVQVLAVKRGLLIKHLCLNL